jgi:hypothetical protein
LRPERLLGPRQLLCPGRLPGLCPGRLRRGGRQLVLGGERLAAARRQPAPGWLYARRLSASGRHPARRRLAASRRRPARGAAARSRSAAGNVPVPWPLAASGKLSVPLTHAAPRKLPVSRALAA